MNNLENLTLVIPAKEEPNALPIVLKELSNYNIKKLDGYIYSKINCEIS